MKPFILIDIKQNKQLGEFDTVNQAFDAQDHVDKSKHPYTKVERRTKRPQRKVKLENY